jgi:hypothetical protein
MNILSVSTRKFCLPLLLCLMSFYSNAQDTLVLRDNVRKIVKTFEFNLDYIICSDYPNGNKVFKFSKDEIVEIRFANGDLYKEFIFSTLNANNDKNSLQSMKEYDLILLTTGEELKSKIIEITNSEIKFKKINYLDGPTHVISKSNIFMITYKTGQKEILSPQNEISISINKTQTSDFQNDLLIRRQAEQDAEANYLPNGALFAGLSTILLSPLFALIPSVLVAGEEPQETNLNYPDPELFQTNYQYNTAYKRKAHKMKKRAVWTGYSIGATINIFVTSLLIFNYY